jgi:hypothetical protein
MLQRSRIAIVIAALIAAPAFAQTTATTVQRDVNQQQRIEEGLQSGQLNTKEAGRLEKEEAKVEKMQKKALKDGTLTTQEKARLDAAQDKVSRDIYREKHNAQTGNPDSASSQRMQQDVQRNINQQQRIEQGVQSGTLTNRETAKLEGGQAKSNRRQAKAAADGHVGKGEQKALQHTQNKQSAKIHKQKHDKQNRA